MQLGGAAVADEALAANAGLLHEHAKGEVFRVVATGDDAPSYDDELTGAHGAIDLSPPYLLDQPTARGGRQLSEHPATLAPPSTSCRRPSTGTPTSAEKT